MKKTRFLKFGLAAFALLALGNLTAPSDVNVAKAEEEVRTFVKLSGPLTDYSGEYLIVSDSGYIFDSSLASLDVDSNCVQANIVDGKITTNRDYAFVIAKDSGKSASPYTIKSSSGYYIGNTGSGSKVMAHATTKYGNYISYSASSGASIRGSYSTSNKYPYLRFDVSTQHFKYFKSTEYSSKEKVFLYVLDQSAETRKVVLNSNEGSGQVSESEVLPENDLYSFTLPECKFDAPYKQVFDSWNTAADGSGTRYEAGAEVELTEETTNFYAQWKSDGKTYYNVLFNANGGEFDAEAVTTVEVASGEVLSSSPTPTRDGYKFLGWSNSVDGELVDLSQALELEEDLTLYAQWEGYAEEVYTLVTDVNQLQVGDQVIIANSEYQMAMSNNVSGTKILQTDVSVEDSVLRYFESDEVRVFTLEKGVETLEDETVVESDTRFAFNDNGNYLSASTNTNGIKLDADKTDDSSWSIEIDEGGNATILAQGDYDANWIRYNKNNTMKAFTCYKTTSSTGWDVQLYKYNANENPAPVVPEVAEQFMESKVESALSLSYLYDGENYSNFTNLSLMLRLVFDYSVYTGVVEETGLYLTTNRDSVDAFVAGEEYSGTKLADDNQDGEYVVRVEAGDDPASLLDTQLYVCGYVSVDGATYVTAVYQVSFKSMLELYANSECESAPVAAAALAYWTNAQ